MSVNFKFKNSVGIKLLVMAVLALGLLIPASMIKGLITERESTRAMVIDEIGSKWGGSQTIAGPILSVPYTVRYLDSDKREQEMTQFAYFLPETLNIESSVTPEVRYRGIYEAVLYNASVIVESEFASPDLTQFGVTGKDVLWDRATISMGISDSKGIKEGIKFLFDSTPLEIRPATGNGRLIEKGVSARVPLSGKKVGFRFASEFKLRGSKHLMFAPLGKTTTAEMSSNWNDPSFSGEYLPVNRELSDNGFKASWNILYLNRNIPQSWIVSKHDFNSSSFGTRFVIPADGYQKTMRMTKYAILFIFMAFTSFFLIEILGKKRIHPVQYLLIGVALLVFYTLLLSITEHAGFTAAYAIASLMLILMITFYTWSILSSRKLAVIIAIVLAALYGFMFIVLQAEDYALLVGSFGVFAIIAITMYITRHVDWYAIDMLSSDD